ncbi:YdcF family protein [Metabacillus sp. 113a]|uniref:YdcF family protein n=2 Tax=unclassified Metabacillus TaxID=2675274 RepID=UPI003CFB511A
MGRKKTMQFAAAGLLLSALIYLFCIHVKIQEYAGAEPAPDADYLIVLGARVNGDVPSHALQNRIDTAADYLKKNRKTLAIVSGGRGNGENRTEADAMREGLIRLGVESSRIVLESESSSTAENIAFSKKLVPNGAKHGVIATNDFHVYRSVAIASQVGLKVTGLPAKTPTVILVKSYLREYLSITNFYLRSVL